LPEITPKKGCDTAPPLLASTRSTVVEPEFVTVPPTGM